MADISGLLGRMAPNIGDDDTQKAGAGLFAQLGIFSPSDKLRQQLQQQQAQQAQIALQQQLAAQAQQGQLAQANSKAGAANLGFNFSPFMAMGGLQNLQNAGQLGAQGTKGVGGNSPASMRTPSLESDNADAGGISPEQIVTNALQKYPDKGTALRVAGKQLAALGQSRNDPYLQNIAANLVSKAVDADKETSGIEATRQNTTKSKFDQNRERVGTPFQAHEANGNLTSQSQEFDAEGNYIGTKKYSTGPNKQITQTLDDPRTQTQKGAEYGEFQKLLVNSDNTITSMRAIADNLQAGAAQGWAATGVSLIDNVVGTLSQFKPDAKYTAKATQALSASKGDFAKWAQKTGVNASLWNDLVSNLAKTYNPTGTITEKDITRAAESVGKNFSNPATVAEVLREAEQRTRGFVDKSYKYMGDGAREASKSQYERFLESNSRPAEGGDETANDPKVSQDDEEAVYASPKTDAEYAKIKKGTQYHHPDDPIGKYRIKK